MVKAKARKKRPPKKIKLDAIKEKSLSAMIDVFVGNWKIRSHYKNLLRSHWELFLPHEFHDEKTKKTRVVHEDYSVAYIPRVDKRKAVSETFPKGSFGVENLTNWPYFVVLKNSGRDDRPQKPVPEGVDLLQEKNIDRKVVIADIDGGEDGSDFYCGPNLYPYDYYAYLLISKDKRPQKRVKKEDIVTMMKFSFLTGITLFFNSIGAGASRKERFHIQGVDKAALNVEGKELEFPIMNDRFVEREQIEGGVYKLKNYPAGAMVFSGKKAPGRVADLVEELECSNNTPYNIIVHSTVDNIDVYLIPRNRNRERSDCIGKNLGGLEMLGVIPVGNIEEPVLGQAGLDKIIHAEDVFTTLNYATISDNVYAACESIDKAIGLYKG
jgi:hypothetical protein